MDTLWDTASRIRAATMRDGLDLTFTRGLEVGPLAHPIVQKNEGNIIYVDHTDATSLRKTYGTSEFAARIVDVDAIWGEQSLLSCLGGQRVDYIMASHVAEHVPDLVTWLAETREVLLPGGQLRLALPDVRFSNDVLRPPTRISDLLAAWLIKARRPQLRDVLDFRLHESCEVDGSGFYHGTASRADVRPIRSVDAALDCARMVLAQPSSYFDVHCLAASGLQFATLMGQLADAGLLSMACAKMIDTAPPLYEFYAFLTPCDDPEAVKRSWIAARDACADPPPGSAEAVAAAEFSRMTLAFLRVSERLAVAEAQNAELEAELAAAAERMVLMDRSVAHNADTIRGLAEAIITRDAEVARTATKMDELGQRLTQSELHVLAVQRSLSWRITTPLRLVKSLITRRA
jgi:hypothetical protein